LPAKSLSDNLRGQRQRRRSKRSYDYHRQVAALPLLVTRLYPRHYWSLPRLARTPYVLDRVRITK
jgi:hypothetical protein